MELLIKKMCTVLCSLIMKWTNSTEGLMFGIRRLRTVYKEHEFLKLRLNLNKDV